MRILVAMLVLLFPLSSLAQNVSRQSGSNNTIGNNSSRTESSAQPTVARELPPAATSSAASSSTATVLSLDPQRSKASVSLRSPMGAVAGRVTDIGGTLEQHGSSVEQSTVTLQGRPASIRVTESNTAIDPSLILASLGQSTVSFRSTRIVADPRGNYQAEGIARWGSQSYKTVIPFQLVRRSTTETVIAFSLQGPFTQLAAVQGQGSVTGTLTFSGKQ